MPEFSVVRINGDPKDTYAAETLTEAIEIAMADPGDTIEYASVPAGDVGFARLVVPRYWMEYTDE